MHNAVVKMLSWWLKLFGVNPFSKTKTQLLLFSAILFYNLLFLVLLIMAWEDTLSVNLLIFDTACVYLETTVKSVTLMANRQRIFRIFSLLSQIEVDYNISNDPLVGKNFQRCLKIAKWAPWLAASITIPAILGALLVDHKQMAFVTWLPPHWDQNESFTFFEALYFVSNALNVFVICMMLAIYDLLFIALAYLLILHLRLLNADFETLFDNDDAETDPYPAAQFKKQFADLLRKQDKIYECLHILSTWLSFPILLVLGRCVLSVCVSMIILLPDKNYIYFLSIISFSLGQPFAYCYIGAILTDMFNNTRHSIYNSGWFSHLDKSRDLVIVQQNLNTRPTIKTVGFIAIDLETFSQLIKACYSVCTFLEATQ